MVVKGSLIVRSRLRTKPRVIVPCQNAAARSIEEEESPSEKTNSFAGVCARIHGAFPEGMDAGKND